MNSDLRTVRSIGAEVAEKLGFELVQVQFLKESGKWYLRYSLDRPGGIGITDCERFSHCVERSIDTKDPIRHSYVLEVSSAGLDRPLVREADYERFTGRQITLTLFQPREGRRRYAGILRGLARTNGEIDVVLDTSEGDQVILPLAGIAQAKLVPDL